MGRMKRWRERQAKQKEKRMESLGYHLTDRMCLL